MELRIDTDHGVIAPYAMMILLSFLAGTCGMFLLNLRRGIRRQTALRQMLLSPLLSLCGGIPYNGAFRTVYTGVHANPVPTLPIQLIEPIVFLLIFPAGLYGFFRRRINTVPAVFFASAASKFMLDFLRASHQGNILSITQILCAGMLIAALLLLLHRHRQQRKHAGKE